MKKNSLVKYLFLLSIFLFSNLGHAQLEKLFIEKYYVSDLKDQTNSEGMKLPAGTTTYRIYADLEKKSKISRIFGNTKFPILIASSDTIYNDTVDGKSFGKDISRIRYSDNLVALDSWLTIGQTTTYKSPLASFGIPKVDDNDGSFIKSSGGFLSNSNSEAGKALTVSDGMLSNNLNIKGWSSNGLIVLSVDTSIFDKGGFKKEFKSTLFELKSDGVSGVDSVKNQVLLAQITTKGELKFNMNLELLIEENGKQRKVMYVSKNEGTNDSTIYSPFLSYPFTCGCTDPNYLEYDRAFVCTKEGACKTPIVIGCMDQSACNFDANANKTLPSLCCYPGKCNNRDITIVCPSLLNENVNCEIYPNPVENDYVMLDVQTGIDQEIKYDIIDIYGKNLKSLSLGKLKLINEKINLENLNAGMYQIKVQVGSSVFSKLIIKK